MLCDYRNALGAPRTGLHAIRMVGDTAAVDYFGTIGLSEAAKGYECNGFGALQHSARQNQYFSCFA